MARMPRLLAIGRLKPGPEAALFAQYNARLRPALAVTELPEARGSAGEVRGPAAGTVARATGGQSFAILTACGPQEISWEDGEGGVFTTRLFRALRKSGGQVPLARLFSEGVQRDVIETSRVLCQREKSCATHPQQTPLFAFGGSGDQISL